MTRYQSPSEAPHPGRKIIHIDMDCFYAAVEMRERPELAGKPIAVGGGSARGVVTTCNYEARKFGVRSAMPGFQARERCPHLVFLPVRFDLYRADSQRIREILRSYTPLVEPLSLDEAYLDVSAIPRYAWDVAKEIRRRIFQETQLTASAGIAANKMLAKIASDWRKPNGQFAITPDAVPAFMQALPVRKLWGVGPKTAARLHAEGIQTCGDLQNLSLAELQQRFGNWATEWFDLCRGIDDRPVQPNRIRKSLSIENTFLENLTSFASAASALEEMSAELVEELQVKAADRVIREAFVKVKFSDFTSITRQRLASDHLGETLRGLLRVAWDAQAKPIRLLGVGVRFVDPGVDQRTNQSLSPQLTLWPNP